MSRAEGEYGFSDLGGSYEPGEETTRNPRRWRRVRAVASFLSEGCRLSGLAPAAPSQEAWEDVHVAEAVASMDRALETVIGRLDELFNRLGPPPMGPMEQ